MIIFPFIVAGAAAFLIALLFASVDELSKDERVVPQTLPDLPAPPPPAPVVDSGANGVPNGSTVVLPQTRWKRVNAILGALNAAAKQSGIPLGLLVGWIAKESAGKLSEYPQPGPGDTKADERGYFQLMPAESKAIGVDHQRLSTDSLYSINAGLALIGKYMGTIDRYGIAPRGSSYYWRLVKLAHSMGSGAVGKLVEKAKAQGATKSWDDFKAFSLKQRVNGPQPAKWFPFVDEIYTIGQPYGFGPDAQMVAGLFGGLPNRRPVYTDIPDPLDMLRKR